MYRLSPLAKFIILYTVLYAGFGVVFPFLPAYFEDRGLTPHQIALAIGLGTVVRLAAGPLAGRLADSRRVWRRILAVCAAGAGAVALAYLAADGFGSVLLVSLAQSALLAPLAPVADALALSAAMSRSGKGFEYGIVRAQDRPRSLQGRLRLAIWRCRADLPCRSGSTRICWP